MVRPLHRLLCLLALAALSLPAFAQTSGGVVTVVPVSNVPQGWSNGNLQTLVTYEARMSQAANAPLSTLPAPRYYVRPTVFTGATVAALVRKRMTNVIPYVGQALLIKDLIEASGLFTDNAGAVLSAPAQPGATCDGTQPFYVSNFNPSWMGCSMAGVIARHCAAYTASNTYPCVGSTVTVQSAPGVVGQYTLTEATPPGQGNPTQGPFGVIYYGPNGQAHSNPSTPGTAATDAQIVNALQSAPWVPGAMAEPFHWPQTNRPLIAEPMPAAMQAVAAQYRTDTGVSTATPEAAPASDLNASPSTAPSNNTGTVAQPAPSISPTAIEFPVFCTWATKICEFVDWAKTDAPADTEKPDVPFEELGDEEVTYDSGLGAGTCPPPATVSLMGGTHEMSFEPVCDLAAGARPFVLISASLLAGLMLLRVFTS